MHIATTAENWNTPDCGKPYNATQQIHLHASHAPMDQSDAGNLGARCTIGATLVVVSVLGFVLGFGGTQEGPQDFSSVLGAWPSNLVLYH